MASLALAIHASLRAQTHGDRLGPSEGGGSRTPSAIGRSGGSGSKARLGTLAEIISRVSAGASVSAASGTKKMPSAAAAANSFVKKSAGSWVGGSGPNATAPGAAAVAASSTSTAAGGSAEAAGGRAGTLPSVYPSAVILVVTNSADVPSGAESVRHSTARDAAPEVAAELEPERPAAPHQHQQPEALPPAPLEAAALFAGPAGWKDAADNSTAAPLRPGAAGEDVEGSSRGWAGEGPRGEAEEASAESRAELSTVMRIFIAYLQVCACAHAYVCEKITSRGAL